MTTDNKTKDQPRKMQRPDVDVIRDNQNDQVFADNRKYLLRYVSTDKEGYKMSFEWNDNILDLIVVPTATVPGDIFAPTNMVLHYASFRNAEQTFSSLEKMNYIFSLIAVCLEEFGQPTRNIEKYRSENHIHTITIVVLNAKKLLPQLIANNLTSNDWGGIL